MTDKIKSTDLLCSEEILNDLTAIENKLDSIIEKFKKIAELKESIFSTHRQQIGPDNKSMKNILINRNKLKN